MASLRAPERSRETTFSCRSRSRFPNRDATGPTGFRRVIYTNVPSRARIFPSLRSAFFRPEDPLMSDASPSNTLAMMRESLSSALVCDALDSLGVRCQSPAIALLVRTVDGLLVGRCKTTLWTDRAAPDPHPYENELLAVDTCLPDQVMIAAAAGSLRSGIWG